VRCQTKKRVSSKTLKLMLGVLYMCRTRPHDQFFDRVSSENVRISVSLLFVYLHISLFLFSTKQATPKQEKKTRPTGIMASELFTKR
jgi:hypothetical protein